MTHGNGKAALVVGGTSGIGAAAAAMLAEQGWRVVISGSRSEAEGDEVARQIPGASYVRADMGDPEAPAALIEETVERVGRLDALVYTAGATAKIAHHDLAGATEDVWERILSHNVRAPWRTIVAAEPHLRESGDAAIVVTGALGGVDVGGSSLPYAVSKAALHHLVKLLGPVLGPEVRINAVAPGLIASPWTASDAWEPLHEFVRERAPLRRVGTPDDVAKVIVGLIDSKYTTGQTLVIDGGLSLV